MITIDTKKELENGCTVCGGELKPGYMTEFVCAACGRQFATINPTDFHMSFRELAEAIMAMGESEQNNTATVQVGDEFMPVTGISSPDTDVLDEGHPVLTLWVDSESNKKEEQQDIPARLAQLLESQKDALGNDFQDDLDNLVLDTMEAVASKINNQDFEGQIRFLLKEGHTPAAILQAVGCKAEFPADN